MQPEYQASPYFTQGDYQKIIQKEDEWHNESLFDSFRLIENELNNIIQPSLMDNNLNSHIRKRLIEKAHNLQKRLDVYSLE